jgi:MFS superfamily sulfate permease-like transporter
VVFIGAKEGIILAVVLSLLAHVRHGYRPHTAVLVRDQRVWSIYTTSNGKVGCNEDHPTGPKR